MTFAVWGTGSYYQKYKKFIDPNEIGLLVDNNPKKQGEILDGHLIYAPALVDFDRCDYIIVLVMHYSEIKQQLLEIKIPQQKVISYKELYKVPIIRPTVISKGKELTIEQWADQNMGIKIAVFSHNFARSGVPVALMNLTRLLQKMGYQVLLCSLESGNLQEDLDQYLIDYMPDVEVIYRDTHFGEVLRKFSFVVVGTLVLSELGTYLSERGLSILWWLHESEENLYFKYKLPKETKQICYCSVGELVNTVFKRYYPAREMKELLYYIPDKVEEERSEVADLEIIKANIGYKDDKFTFAVIGGIYKRKAQDIIVQAVKYIPQGIRERIQIFIIGAIPSKAKMKWEQIRYQVPQIHLTGEVSQEQVDEMYELIDVLVCPSRSDPMPTVVTQAMQHRKPCIISDQVGQSVFMKQGEGGFVFQSEDERELAQLMVWFVEHPQDCEKIGGQARKIYETYFTEDHMRKSLEVILKQIER